MTIFLRALQRLSIWATLLLIALASGSLAMAGLIDTLTGLTPGDQVGCNYTFQNGDPSIPCATDTVGADGTVSFLKPDAAFDNIEYFDITTGDDIVEIEDPENAPIDSQLTPGTQYPLVQPTSGTFTSFFDVFFDISLENFNGTGLQAPGDITVGETFTFSNGSSNGLPDVTIPGFTGTVEVTGFDKVSNQPEPATLLLFAASLCGMCVWRRLRALAFERR
jgi:hypothetical protein